MERTGRDLIWGLGLEKAEMYYGIQMANCVLVAVAACSELSWTLNACAFQCSCY